MVGLWGLWRGSGGQSEVYNNLFGFPHIEEEIVALAPPDHLAHLCPVVGLIVVTDETHNGCVLCKYSDVIGAVGQNTVVGQQSEDDSCTLANFPIHADRNKSTLAK